MEARNRSYARAGGRNGAQPNNACAYMSDKEQQLFRRVVWPLAIAETIAWASMYYSFPALLTELERDLGWSKTQLSGAFTAALVISACLAPVVGRLIDRGFGRVVFTGSALLGALGLVLLSQVEELWQFYCVWIVMGIAMAGALYEICFALLTRVMGLRARRAITLVTLVAGFAGTVAFPTVHVLTDFLGWRGTVLVLSGVVATVAAPLILFASRISEVDSGVHLPAASQKPTAAVSVLRSAVFWLLALAFATIALDHGVLFTHILPLLDERGFGENTAVLAASLIGPMQVTGRLITMAIEKRVSSWGISIGSFVAMGIAGVSLFGSSSLPALLASFVFFQGTGYGVTSIIRPVVTAELLGRENFGLIAGFLAIPVIGMTAAAPTIAAVVWEYGGYDTVIALAIGATVVGLLAILGAARIAWKA